jgi:hypothetical protein
MQFWTTQNVARASLALFSASGCVIALAIAVELEVTVYESKEPAHSTPELLPVAAACFIILTSFFSLAALTFPAIVF